ncbi:MAG: hypothetical protein HYY58_02200 [Candidatus Omnitrophica bacterium]|nr:hypothetical protein [Candidatus Omnitrophota bacterium]
MADSPRPQDDGFALAELIGSVALLLLGIVALIGALMAQTALNEHARNITWAMNDATRVMERLRLQNSGDACAATNVNPPAGFASWDAWLADTTANGGGGKSLQPNPAANERVVPTTTGTDPRQVTIAICWRHRNRTLGECDWDGTQLIPNELLVMPNDTAAIDSPAMLTTLITCRQ